MTKDEHLLLEVYRHLKKRNDFEGHVDPYIIGKELGFKEHLIENILKGLMKANLLKKYGHNEAGLTPLGKEVAESLV